MDAISLGQYLKQTREGRGLGLNEVSRRSHDVSLTREGTISPAQLLHVERGKTKRPGLLKLATLADIYDIDLSILASFLDEKSDLSGTKAEKGGILNALKKLDLITETISSVKGGLVDRYGNEISLKKYEHLEEDLINLLQRVTYTVVPASDGQPPVSLSFLQRRLNEPNSDGKTRRNVLRLLLTLNGLDLEDAAAAFFAAVPREMRSTVLRGPINQPSLPISKEKRMLRSKTKKGDVPSPKGRHRKARGKSEP